MQDYFNKLMASLIGKTACINHFHRPTKSVLVSDELMSAGICPIMNKLCQIVWPVGCVQRADGEDQDTIDHAARATGKAARDSMSATLLVSSHPSAYNTCVLSLLQLQLMGYVSAAQLRLHCRFLGGAPACLDACMQFAT